MAEGGAVLCGQRVQQAKQRRLPEPRDARGARPQAGCVGDELLLGREAWPDYMYQVPDQLRQLSLP